MRAFFIKQQQPIKHLKKIQIYYEELEEIKKNQIQVLLPLRPSKIIIQKILEEKEISRETIWSNQTKKKANIRPLTSLKQIHPYNCRNKIDSNCSSTIIILR